ncbi:hypothetical protein ACE4RV_06275 [Acetobacter persici]|uniref:hypothetical protein n=1 Tax=Acetobacter persici TaxID=1076596 RepID=UPI001F32A7EC|nr:hypothetical protein [Acetobacter persici]MCG0998174.1 hypothetical protein [Acetobacter persici]
MFNGFFQAARSRIDQKLSDMRKRRANQELEASMARRREASRGQPRDIYGRYTQADKAATCRK